MALEKATITNTVTGETFPVLFNPEEYTVNREVTYAQSTVPGSSAPLVQFVAGNMQTLEMELLVDTYEEHRSGSTLLNAARSDVRTLTSRLTDLMSIDPRTHAPPVLLFVWGSLSFACVLARASQRFTMFLPDGVPVRASLQVSFNEFRNLELEVKSVKRETADYSKTHEIREGDSLSVIAAREYGTPRLWRPIALRNGIVDPRALTLGQRLVVPRLPYRDPESGEVYAS